MLPGMPEMSHSATALATEEDVRSKVVISWLSLHGFAPADILVERSFELRVGRSVFRVGESTGAGEVIRPLHPRADVLVRHVDGRNLLVVEVKAPGEPLDEEAREQGISYARLLRGGGIAPFVVLTDGHRTRIFDTISGDEVVGELVPGDHRHARSGFRVTGEHSDLRAEALEKLISLDCGNLAAFCRGQVEFHMRKLRDTDPQSGRKYIPSLYVERPKAQHRLDSLIAEGRRVILIVGPPQVGKTNLVCHSVERRLDQGEPTLFYPAIAVGGLAAELRDDFEWVLRQGVGSDALAADRLARVARASGRRLVIFVDGWNEAAVEAAHSIDAAAARIASDQVTFVISMTNVAARRLLIDAVGDPTFVADEVGVRPGEMVLLELRNPAIQKGWSVVMLNDYDDEECDRAYELYSRVLNVEVPRFHGYTAEPLLLRNAMLASAGGTLPKTLNGVALLQNQVNAKLERARLDFTVGKMLLVETAEELLECGAPARVDRLLNRLRIPVSTGVPSGLFEAALLVRRAEDLTSDGVDFYFQRERDFVVSYWTRNWARSLRDPQSRLAELEQFAGTEVGRSALGWFLREACNRELRDELFLTFASTAAEPVRLLMLQHVPVPRPSSGLELEDILSQVRAGLRDGSPEVRLHAVIAWEELIDNSASDADRLISDREVVEDVLRLDTVYPLEVDSTGEQVLLTFRQLHGYDESYLDEALGHHSRISELLADLASDSSVRGSAVKAFGYAAPLLFFRWFSERLPLEPAERDIVAPGLRNAVERLRELMYWEYDRAGGLVDVLGDDEDEAEAREERTRHHQIFSACFEPVIRAFPGTAHEQALTGFLSDLIADLPEYRWASRARPALNDSESEQISLVLGP